MKQILEEWKGKYEVNGEINTDLYNFNPKDGDDFHITLLSKRREISDEDILSTRRL